MKKTKESVIKKNKRHIIQILFTALTNGYLMGFIEGKIYKGNLKKYCVPGLNCYSCPGALGSCPIGSIQAVLAEGNFKFTFYIAAFLMFFGSLLGRFVCGFLCPFGLVQDLLYKIPFFKKFKNLPGHKVLVWLKYLIFILFVILLPMFAVDMFGMGKPWFCKYICPSGTLMGGIPLLITNEQLQAFTGVLFYVKLAILILIVILSLIVYRPFCKYICPLGAVYSLFNPIAFYRYKVDKDKCTECGICQQTCKMDIKVYEKPNSFECIRCGECIKSCPHNAIEREKLFRKKN